MKVMPDAVYYAADQMLDRKILSARPKTANVVKITTDGSGGFSWLRYDNLDSVAFPRLHEAWVFRDGCLKRHITYRNSKPILHRKELLVAPDDRRIHRWRKLTERAEVLGLFDYPYRIGTEKAWNNRLSDLGLKIVGHSIVRVKKYRP